MNPAWVMALSAAQHVLHQALKLDPNAADAFTALNGRSIRVQLNQPQLSVTLEFEGGQPWLNWAQGPADVTLSGDLSALIQVARSLAAGNSALVMEGLNVEGSVGVLKALADAAASLSIDLEDELSKQLGDPMAGALLAGLKAVYHNLKRQSGSLKAQADEFIRHEQPWLLTRDAFDDFTDRARRLRHRIERLERKL